MGCYLNQNARYKPFDLQNTATVEAFKSSPDRPNQPQNNEVNPTQEKNKATQHNNDESTSEHQHRLGKLGENLHLHI